MVIETSFNLLILYKAAALSRGAAIEILASLPPAGFLTAWIDITSFREAD